VEYAGKGYRTAEVKEMTDTSLMGYGKVLLMEGEQRGRKEGEQKGRLEVLNLIKAGCSMEALKERLEAELAAAESGTETRSPQS
jgi:hypothetical protein